MDSPEARATSDMTNDEPELDIVISHIMFGVGGGDAKKGDSPRFLNDVEAEEEEPLPLLLQALTNKTRAKKVDPTTINLRTSFLFCLICFRNESFPTSVPMVCCMLVNEVSKAAAEGGSDKRLRERCRPSLKISVRCKICIPHE